MLNEPPRRTFKMGEPFPSGTRRRHIHSKQLWAEIPIRDN
jgi:hypothetical protein